MLSRPIGCLDSPSVHCSDAALRWRVGCTNSSALGGLGDVGLPGGLGLAGLGDMCPGGGPVNVGPNVGVGGSSSGSAAGGSGSGLGPTVAGGHLGAPVRGLSAGLADLAMGNSALLGAHLSGPPGSPAVGEDATGYPARSRIAHLAHRPTANSSALCTGLMLVGPLTGGLDDLEPTTPTPTPTPTATATPTPTATGSGTAATNTVNHNSAANFSANWPQLTTQHCLYNCQTCCARPSRPGLLSAAGREQSPHNYLACSPRPAHLNSLPPAGCGLAHSQPAYPYQQQANHNQNHNHNHNHNHHNHNHNNHNHHHHQQQHQHNYTHHAQAYASANRVHSQYQQQSSFAESAGLFCQSAYNAGTHRRCLRGCEHHSSFSSRPQLDETETEVELGGCDDARCQRRRGKRSSPCRLGWLGAASLRRLLACLGLPLLFLAVAIGFWTSLVAMASQPEACASRASVCRVVAG